METRVRTLPVMTVGEGRRWGNAARCAEMPIPADGDSSHEGLLASDRSEPHDSADSASFEERRSSDNDQRGDTGSENLTLFARRVAAFNLRGYQRKKTEVLATALRHKVDALALIETRSRTQGKVEGEDHDLWESGANGTEGKALLVHT